MTTTRLLTTAPSPFMPVFAPPARTFVRGSGTELWVDLADEHHPGDVDGLGVGDPETVAELGGLAQPAHQR